MKKIAAFVFASLFAVGCGSPQKIEALKPEPDQAEPLLYDNAVSFIDIPVVVKIKDIENQTNKTLTGLIYEDNNIEDDDYQVKIWKLAPITLANEKGKIKTVLPLKAHVKYRIGTKRLGIDLFDTKEFNFNGNVSLVSDVALTNWKVKTHTEFKSIQWNESPTMNVMGKAVPITYIINPALQLFKSKIEKSIDEAIAQSMDFKPSVLDALDKICTPFQMNQAYDTWLRINPSELYTTEAKLQQDKIMFEMGLKCTIETLVGQKPTDQFDRSKIVLKPVAKMPDHITANIVAVSTYADASKILTKNFMGQEFGSGSKKVKVQGVELWQKNGKMIIALDLLGSLNGRIYLSGVPQYNDQTKEIYFDQLDYVLDTKGRLTRTANWLLQGYVLRKMQETCRYSIQPNLDEGKANLLQYMKNYSPMPGVFVNGQVGDIQFQKIQLTNKAIIAFVKITGEVSVVVDGLK
ncbi:DUF4403 family protein [Flavobacterium caeni]|uniref:DUF4403 family protein n=1 Tax=Flavobacterium caeni TaxID=490189 RepID=A0A1G5IBS4_9FLAO|nr:DUF4403 family protein [Flavobacterium caeni]SCY73130.1 protein of unknown function [Flavobacterium caeni]